MSAELLRKLAEDFKMRAARRDEIGSDDGEDCDGEDHPACHTVSAVATWYRAARILERAADDSLAPSGETGEA